MDDIGKGGGGGDGGDGGEGGDGGNGVIRLDDGVVDRVFGWIVKESEKLERGEDHNDNSSDGDNDNDNDGDGDGDSGGDGGGGSVGGSVGGSDGDSDGLELKGLPWQSIPDSLRPLHNALWHHLSHTQRRRFLTKVRDRGRRRHTEKGTERGTERHREKHGEERAKMNIPWYMNKRNQ